MPIWLIVLLSVLGTLLGLFFIASLYCSLRLAAKADANLEKIIIKKELNEK